MTQKRITLQDIFDAAWQAFVVERRPPGVYQADGGSHMKCMYLTPEGCKCAIGLCIPDGHPFQNLEETFDEVVMRDIRSVDPLFGESVHETEREALVSFQSMLHDNLKTGFCWPSTEVMVKAYTKVASSFCLKVPSAGAEQ